MGKASRKQLVAALARCQGLFGAIQGRYNNDRSSDRAEAIQELTREGFDLCVDVLECDPPATGEGEVPRG